MHFQCSTAAIILAAGSSSRMGAGRHKLLLLLNDRPVLAHVIEAALVSQARPIIVVLGHQAEQVRAQLARYNTDSAITYVENPDYLQGMSTSMCVGLTYLQNQINAAIASVDSALIMLGDQPLVTPRMLDTLIDLWHTTGKPVVAPLYAGKRGNPTLFATSLFPELLQVSGDEGGRSVIERHKQELATVELGDAVANYDVDTWEAYQQVVDLWQQKGQDTRKGNAPTIHAEDQ
ncbi:MAG TPA: nucleotidyltransferase family protein [Ktedonobacteraceae bacterium]|nr:nucleotidyltransferase family protein [Ktedonobacteraceae bacterium]